MKTCKQHPDSEGKWVCDLCDGYFCDSCIKISTVQGMQLESCAECGGRVTPYIDETKPANADEEKHGIIGDGDNSFYSRLPSALTYPVRGDGKFILLTGSVFFFVLDLMTALPFMGFLVALFGFGFLAGYMFTIILDSSNGQTNHPTGLNLTTFIRIRL